MARGSVQVDGQTRTYRVFVPARPKKPPALVLVFHGGFGTGARVASQTGFDAEAEKRGFIAVYPDGLGRAWNAGPCCGAPSRLGVNDVGFVQSCSTSSADSTHSTSAASTRPASRTAGCSRTPSRAGCPPIAAARSGCGHAHHRLLALASGIDPPRARARRREHPVRGRTRDTRRGRPRVAAGAGGHRSLAHAERLSRGRRRRRSAARVTTSSWTPCRNGTGRAARDHRRSGHVWPKAHVQHDARDLAVLRRASAPLRLVVALALQLVRQVARLEAGRVVVGIDVSLAVAHLSLPGMARAAE